MKTLSILFITALLCACGQAPEATKFSVSGKFISVQGEIKPQGKYKAWQLKQAVGYAVKTLEQEND